MCPWHAMRAMLWIHATQIRNAVASKKMFHVFNLSFNN